MKVTKEDLKGDIKDFPLHVVQAMVDEQVKQGNKANVRVFQKDSTSDYILGGFDWHHSDEGDGFWYILINRKQFDLMPEPIVCPKVMMVSDDRIDWYKRVVFMEENGKYISWSNAETLKESEEVCGTYAWNYAKDIPETIELTLEQIAEKFGVDVENIKIKD